MTNITVDEVVRDLLSDQEKYTTHEYLRLLNIANRGLRELTFDVLGKTNITTLTVDSTLRVDLPCDYVDYTFIGVITSSYELAPLGMRRTIPLNGSDNVQTDHKLDKVNSWNPLFGIGGGQNENGYYAPSIDKENWQMVFSSVNVGQTIYLEYISNGKFDGEQNSIHPYAYDALLSYTHWKSIAKKRNYTKWEKDDAKAEYYNEKRLARARMTSFTKEEAIQQIRKGFKQAPKI
jgi:hypothetical protein